MNMNCSPMAANVHKNNVSKIGFMISTEVSLLTKIN